MRALYKRKKIINLNYQFKHGNKTAVWHMFPENRETIARKHYFPYLQQAIIMIPLRF